jgi:hypothetical protein
LKTSFRDRALKLLEVLGRKSERLDHYPDLHPSTDLALVDARTTGEFRYLVDYLLDRKLIEPYRYDPGVADREDKIMIRLTPAGWEALGPIGRRQMVRGHVFVAMWFTPDLDEAYQRGIERAIIDPAVGCTASNLKTNKEPTNVSTQILAEITRAEFVVADLTGHRPNVYFEAGYALALGRKVILTCRQKEAKKVHFDVAPYRRINWRDVNHLYEELKDTLVMLVGKRDAGE